MTLSGALYDLVAAAKDVIANWEQGNLAYAVRQLDTVTKKIEAGPEPNTDESGNKRFQVGWAIDAWTKTPLDAANEAFTMVRSPDTTAVVFEVWCAGDVKPATIDLMGPETATEAASLSRGFRYLVAAAKKVAESWERGDLAHAVQKLDDCIKDIEKEFAPDRRAPGQKRFLVSREIDIWAKSHPEAARGALACMQDPHTAATIFDVWRPGAPPISIDVTKTIKLPKRTGARHLEP